MLSWKRSGGLYGEELFENIKDAYNLMVFDEVPEEYSLKELTV